MNNSKIELFYDLVDKACMKLYEELGIDYLEALIRVSSDLVEDFNDSKLSDEAIAYLQDVYQKLNDASFFNEEIRLSLEMLIIKGFKHINYSLDLMTPDVINYLIAHLISKIHSNDLRIIDTALGTGNMLNAICNFPNIDILEAIGIENDEVLVNLSKACSDLQNNGIVIYYQNAVSKLLSVVDVIVGDLPNQVLNAFEKKNGFDYLPYLIILERMNNLVDNGYFIYLIDNDFFSHTNSLEFKKQLEETSTLLGLLVLPNSIFKENHIGKSILIGRKKKYQSFDMNIATLNFKDQEEIKKILGQLDQWIEKF